MVTRSVVAMFETFSEVGSCALGNHPCDDVAVGDHGDHLAALDDRQRTLLLLGDDAAPGEPGDMGSGTSSARRTAAASSATENCFARDSKNRESAVSSYALGP
jgi:hypothetical protein